MNENLTTQIAAALVQDGTIKMTGEAIATAIADAVGELSKQYLFLGVAVPGTNPGKILEPTLYVAVAGGWYPGFSNGNVNEGQIVFFTSDDGGAWTASAAYDPQPGGGSQVQPLVVEGTFGTDDYLGSVFYPAETPGNPTFEEAKSFFFAGGSVLLKGSEEPYSGDFTRLVIGHMPGGEDGDFVYDESLYYAGGYCWYKTYNS